MSNYLDVNKLRSKEICLSTGFKVKWSKHLKDYPQVENLKKNKSILCVYQEYVARR